MEFVWVVRRRDLFPDCSPQGFRIADGEELEARILRPFEERGFFVERREAERNPSWKQLIPYCLVASGDRLLCLERLKAQSESRLHGLLSIGVGGHVDPVDLEGPEPAWRRAAEREIREELHCSGEIGFEPLGFLNDDGSPVGAVHLGLVLGLRWPDPDPPEIRERSKMRGRLQGLAELRKMCEASAAFESWSAAILAQRGWEARFLNT